MNVHKRYKMYKKGEKMVLYGPNYVCGHPWSVDND